MFCVLYITFLCLVTLFSSISFFTFCSDSSFLFLFLSLFPFLVFVFCSIEATAVALTDADVVEALLRLTVYGDTEATVQTSQCFELLSQHESCRHTMVYGGGLSALSILSRSTRMDVKSHTCKAISNLLETSSSFFCSFFLFCLLFCLFHIFTPTCS